MANEQNLQVITHEEAVELGRKGGLVKSERKQFANIKYCRKKCPYFSSCPGITASQVDPKKRCFIKTYSKEIQNYFVQLFDNGEEGLIGVALELHFRLLAELKTGKKKPTAKELREAIETTLAVKKGIYGDRDSGNSVQVNVIVSNQVDV